MTRRIRVVCGVLVAVAAMFGLQLPGADAVHPNTRRVTDAADGTQGNGGASAPDFSADGRLATFDSSATNLVPGDTNGRADVFVKDLVTGAIERVSVSSSGVQGDGNSFLPVISDDGRFVAFVSRATNLVSGDTNGALDGPSDIFIRDRQTNTTERVSVATSGAEGNAPGATGSGAPAISGDGRFVVFNSEATNLVSGDTNGSIDIFIRDRQTNTTERVNLTSAGEQASGGGALSPDVSRDGRLVSFRYSGADLVSGDTNGATDVFVRDRTAQTTRLVSSASDGTVGNQGATAADISDNGRFVAFGSNATNLVSGDTNGVTDVFRKDLLTGTTTRISTRSDGTQGNQASGSSTVSTSGDGRFVGYSSNATNLASSGTDSLAFTDIFVKDTLTGENIRVSEGSEPNGNSFTPTLAPFTPYAGYTTQATNTATSDANGTTSDGFAHQFRKASGSFVLDNQGGIFTFGAATFRGSVPALRAAGTPVGNANIIDLEVTPSGNGYYVLDDAGGIFTFGDAAFFGSVPGLRASGVTVGPGRILDMAVTPSGQGYLILDDAGGIFTFGDAAFFGSIPQLRASGVAVGTARGVDLAITPNGRGYLILDDTGGIFTFGDGAFFGSLPGLRAVPGSTIGSAPSIRMAVTPSGNGYLVLDSAGGMFTFGDAQFFGSIPGLRAAGTPIGNAAGVDLAMTPTGLGYVILDDQGGMFTFGDGEFFGSIPQLRATGAPIGPNSSLRVDLVSSLVGG